MKYIEKELTDENGELSARCPVCNADIFPIGDEDDPPCEHIFLAHNDAGILDNDFYLCKDRDALKQIHLELAKKVEWLEKPWDEMDEEDREDAMGDVTSWDVLEAYLKTLGERDDLTMIVFKSTGGCCGGPCYEVRDTLVFKT